MKNISVKFQPFRKPTFLFGWEAPTKTQNNTPPSPKKKHVLLDSASVQDVIQPTFFGSRSSKRGGKLKKKHTEFGDSQADCIPAMAWKLVTILSALELAVMARAEVFRAVNPKLKAEVSL